MKRKWPSYSEMDLKTAIECCRWLDASKRSYRRKYYRARRASITSNCVLASLVVILLGVRVAESRRQTALVVTETVSEYREPCDDGRACDADPGTHQILLVSDDDASFVIDDRYGLSTANKREVPKYAEFYKAEYDKWVFGKRQRKIRPKIKVGFERDAPGVTSGNHVDGEFPCGHNMHVRTGTGVNLHTMSVFRHETAHALLWRYHSIGDRWFSEGWAECFQHDGKGDFNKRCHDRYHDASAAQHVAMLFDNRENGSCSRCRRGPSCPIHHHRMYVLTASLIDHLIAEHGMRRMRRFLEVAHAKKYDANAASSVIDERSNFKAALKVVYNQTPTELETRWRRRLCGRHG